MPDPVTGAIAAAGGSQILGGIGANKAAGKQIKAQNKANALNERMYDESQMRIQDFLGGADVGALRDFIGTDGPTFNPTSYNDFASSDQAQRGMTNAARSALNSISGRGDFGSTSSIGDLVSAQGNTLDSLFSANQYNEMNNFNNQRLSRNDNLNELLKLVNISQSATGQQNTLGQNFAQTQGANFNRLGQMQAGKSMIPFQVGQQLLNTGAQALTPTQSGGSGVFI